MGTIEQKIEQITKIKVSSLSPLSGGCVGDVYRVIMQTGPDLVVKVGDGASGLMAEGFSLQYLATNAQLPVPDVLFADDNLLLLSFIQSDGTISPGAQRHAGELVARLHLVSHENGFGFDSATTIGGLHQPNPWHKNWVDFFREQRLLYMGRMAMDAGNLPAQLMRRLEKFSGDLDKFIQSPEKSSLIHGDMWTGNVLVNAGRISGFIDPATYYADPEIELAFTQMFGTFGDAFFAEYQNIRKINPGFFEERLSIYNLYPLLVHVCLFAGGYVHSVDGTLKKFGY